MKKFNLSVTAAEAKILLEGVKLYENEAENTTRTGNKPPLPTGIKDDLLKIISNEN